MTVQDLIKDVTTADLTTFARYIPTPADFLLTQTVFAKVSIQDVMWRIKNTGRYINAAKYRAFDASVPFSDRQAWQTSTQGMLPSLGQKLMVGEVELLLQEASRGADASRLEQLLYDDVERHVEAINSRLELAAGGVLTDGKFSLAAENGLTLDVDFGVPAQNMPTAPKLWSDPTADAIADELGWLSYLDGISAPWDAGTARLLPRVIKGRTRGPAARDDLDRVRVALCDAGDPTGRPFRPINPKLSHRLNQRGNALEPITGVNAVVISR
ncbi:major capsid protein [Streptomyces sp. NPDC001982]|uniref:major capsid protein n=1 Tax=Streptomyces sp. NPDC001982 TaxID=3154405 RepID=UPI00332018CF